MPFSYSPNRHTDSMKTLPNRIRGRPVDPVFLNIQCSIYTVLYCITILPISIVFGSFGLSTKEPYTIMLCPSWLASSALASSVHISPWHRVRHRNFIFGILMHICPSYMHIKYLVILTCRF